VKLVMIHTRVTWHQWYQQFDIWHPSSVIFLKVGGMRFLKQCSQALLPAPSPIFFYQIPLVPHSLFWLSPLTESLGQAMKRWLLLCFKKSLLIKIFSLSFVLVAGFFQLPQPHSKLLAQFKEHQHHLKQFQLMTRKLMALHTEKR